VQVFKMSTTYIMESPKKCLDQPPQREEFNFREELAFLMVIKGTVNGRQFSVEGKGFGNATTGKVKGKWTCPGGKLPISWAALAGTLGFGYKCFTKYKDGGANNFYQECMPDGYTQERIVRFQGDGNIKSYHEVYVQKGVVVNKVTLQGDGFKPSSPVLNNGIESSLPSTETTFPFENGLKSLVHHLFPLKHRSGEFIVATQITVNRPLGCTSTITIPPHHFSRGEIKQYTDACDNTDHVVQEVAMEGYGHSTTRRERPNEFDMIGFDSKACKKKDFDQVIEQVDQEFFRSLRRQKKSSGDCRFQY